MLLYGLCDEMIEEMMLDLGMTPREIVSELDRHIIGQNDAKKAVAIALRNRYRRKEAIPVELREEIVPKNILMIGPTGVGKTEIARRLAKMSGSPFIKVEATKFTEVGYVGRDVESIIRDLVDIAINSAMQKARKVVTQEATEKAIEIILNRMLGKQAGDDLRLNMKNGILSGVMDDDLIEIDVLDSGNSAASSFEIPGIPGASMGVFNVSDMFSKALGVPKRKTKKMTVKDALRALVDEESDKMIDEDKIASAAVASVESDGIVFLDEVDKIASRAENSKGGRGEVSREGVQRDLLPLIEGTTVTTKYGQVRTDHILFIASGAFHLAKPSDLLPELQGRLPIRVELKPLSKADFVRILQEPEASLLKQYVALLATESVVIKFDQSAIEQIALIAEELNSEVENIGARRLHTVLEKLLEEISFDASDKTGTEFVIDVEYVKGKLAHIQRNTDLSKFIL